jgi:hypothetical protein
MSARRLRAAIVVGAALVLTVGTLAGCSRKSAPDSAAGDTATETTAIAGTSVVPPSSDTTASTAPPEGDPNASSTTLEADDNTDAFGHTPEQVQAFRAAYSAAFEAECRRIWASVGGGLLSDPDFAEDQYSVDDCLGELDPDWGELADSVEEAQTTGADDAQIAASDLADPLCAADGVTCWSYGD